MYNVQLTMDNCGARVADGFDFLVFIASFCLYGTISCIIRIIPYFDKKTTFFTLLFIGLR